MKGYFAWSVSPDGTIRGAGPASDGELYFVTSLIFASNRWGNDGDIDYLAEAQNILNCAWEKDGRADFYRECARASREYLHASIDPETGLNPDNNNFDGSPRTFNFGGFGGFGDFVMKPTFRFDSWRVPMNIALDYSWCCEDREWQTNYANTIQAFLYSKGIDDFVDQYNVDGTDVQFVMPA